VIIVRKFDYKFSSLNSPSNTTIFVVFSLMSPTLENATRAAHSFYSNASVSDIRDSVTKIIDITLSTRGIISENY
jgi:hypothetical protein